MNVGLVIIYSYDACCSVTFSIVFELPVVSAGRRLHEGMMYLLTGYKLYETRFVCVH